jgi:hypothetical protein
MYTATAEAALHWVARNQERRACGRDRYMIMERRSKGGWGVWDNQEQCWVFLPSND